MTAFTCHHTCPCHPIPQFHHPIPRYVQTPCNSCLVHHARFAEAGLRFAYMRPMQPIRRRLQSLRNVLVHKRNPELEAQQRELKAVVRYLEQDRERRVREIWVGIHPGLEEAQAIFLEYCVPQG